MINDYFPKQHRMEKRVDVLLLIDSDDIKNKLFGALE